MGQQIIYGCPYHKVIRDKKTNEILKIRCTYFIYEISCEGCLILYSNWLKIQ